MTVGRRRLCGILASMLAGCAPASRAPAPSPPEIARGSFTSAEGTRQLVVARPGSARSGRALLVVLHGCLQSADDVARGTRFTEVGAREGFVVLYPEQPASAHPQRCWNWFTPSQTARGSGEAALLAAMIDSVARAERVDARRIGLVGLSAGGAMAAQLVVAYPERFAGLAMHSGIAAGAATDVATALRVMGSGPVDGAALGDAALAVMGANARPIPVLLLHGSADKVVSPRNLTAAAAQWTRINARAPGGGARGEPHLREGLGHAWSGGSTAGSSTAPAGPDATGMIVDFFRSAGVLR